MSRRPIELNLSASEKEELDALRTRGKRPYTRERAAALLNAGGESGLPGALQGLLRPRTPRTAYQWVLSDDWATLKQRVDDFFNQFRNGSALQDSR